MNNNFLSQKYNFLDNNIGANNLNSNQTPNFSKTYYNPKEDKESSDLVLQKMQLSLNNFILNLKKTENIENIDSYPIQTEEKPLDKKENSFNFINSNFIQNKNIFNNIQNINTAPNESFPRGKEKSESILTNRTNNNINNINNLNNYFKSPYNQEKEYASLPFFNNSMYSFHSNNNNNLNDINKNNYNINNNNNYNNYIQSQRTKTENNENKSSYPLEIEKHKNSIILINENSSYSSEENKNVNNSYNNIKEKKDKNNEPISIINNNESDFNKIVEKIK